jgi:multiple sugar transport system permease protein
MPFLYMPKQSLRVISTALFTFKGPYGAQWEIICAGVMIALLPTLIVFIFMQRYIYNGLVQGAVKQ